MSSAFSSSSDSDENPYPTSEFISNYRQVIENCDPNSLKHLSVGLDIEDSIVIESFVYPEVRFSSWSPNRFSWK